MINLLKSSNTGECSKCSIWTMVQMGVCVRVCIYVCEVTNRMSPNTQLSTFSCSFSPPPPPPPPPPNTGGGLPANAANVTRASIAAIEAGAERFVFIDCRKALAAKGNQAMGKGTYRGFSFRLFPSCLIHPNVSPHVSSPCVSSVFLAV